MNKPPNRILIKISKRNSFDELVGGLITGVWLFGKVVLVDLAYQHMAAPYEAYVYIALVLVEAVEVEV